MGIRSAVIAVATAMQESQLLNINYGDRDSLGLFQQRPSMGWGTAAQVTDPAYAADAFLQALQQHQATDPSWARQPLWANAQAVQNSGFPFAYAKWETQAARAGQADRDRRYAATHRREICANRAALQPPVRPALLPARPTGPPGAGLPPPRPPAHCAPPSPRGRGTISLLLRDLSCKCARPDPTSRRITADAVETVSMTTFLTDAGYWALIVFAFVQACCIPISSEITFGFAGVLAYQGHLSLPLVIVIGTLAELAGSSTAYGLGRLGGRSHRRALPQVPADDQEGRRAGRAVLRRARRLVGSRRQGHPAGPCLRRAWWPASWKCRLLPFEIFNLIGTAVWATALSRDRL